LTPFERVISGSLRQAIGLLDPEYASVRLVAGGTTVMLMMRAGVFQPRRLDLDRHCSCSSL
jgi:aerobic carbon-monoxide dehydrogenase medium subunit